MGYDMYWHKAPERAENVGIFDDPAYFRLNIWGMGRIRAVMTDLGMVYTPEGGRERFPDLSDYDLTDEQYDAIEYHDESWVSQELKDLYVKLDHTHKIAHNRYKRAVAEYLAATPPGGRGIPAHKLASNDGWIVTPEEIRQALSVYGDIRAAHGAAHERILFKMLESEDPGWVKLWDEWIEWITEARKYEGFRVH